LRFEQMTSFSKLS